MSSTALIDNNAPGAERIEFRPSTRAFLFKSVGGWMMIAIVAVTFGAAALLAVPVLILMCLFNATSRFSLEGDRLFMRRGLLFRSEEEIELYRVKDIRVTFSVIQQMFGNGTLELISSDQTGTGRARRKSLIVRNVEGAREIREELRRRVEAARRRAGVREFDFS